MTVQRLLNRNRHRVEERLEIAVNGIAGPETIAAIRLFQTAVMHLRSPDGRVDPDGRMLAALNAFNELGSAHAKKERAPAQAPILVHPICFPLRKRPSMSYAYTPNADHCRYFGAHRKTKSGGYRAHAACDLIAPVGAEILAVDDGEILADMYYFYLHTNALEVRHQNALVVRYGEISSTASGLKKGRKLNAAKL
jgi:murein DD-endopeptidase MepM/ murein hydrolase activator NlpD